MIKAEMCAGYSQHDFDATPWFEQANDKELFNLAQHVWCSPHANRIATDMSDRDKDIGKVLKYAARNGFRFKVAVDERQAISWCLIHRPKLANKLRIKKFTVIFTARMKATVAVVDMEDLPDAIQEIDIPESDAVTYDGIRLGRR